MSVGRVRVRSAVRRRVRSVGRVRSVVRRRVRRRVRSVGGLGG